MHRLSSTCTRIPALLLVMAGTLSLAGPASLRAANAHVPKVLHVPIEGTIDTGLAVFLERALEQADEESADAVILHINTLGGRVDAAVKMRDALLSSPVKTVAFVDRRAISAGALIALAAHEIVMAPGATIGAATPVTMGQPGAPPQAAEEKTVSYVRKEFASTAEQRGRPVKIAEAMVDASVDLPDVTDKGKLLTLTTGEALKLGVADARAEGIGEILDRMGLPDAQLVEVKPNWAEGLVRLVTHPVVSSLLLSLGMLALVAELYTVGFGLAGIFGVVALALFFGGHLLAELAGWEELLLIAAGAGLIALEVIAVPGFGLVGLAGILALGGGLLMLMVGPSPSVEAIGDALLAVGLALVVALLGFLAMLKLVVPRTLRRRGVILRTELGLEEGYGSSADDALQLLGHRGVTTSALRPSGIATIDGQRRDVVAEGEYVSAGEPVVVSRVDGNRIVVRRQLLPQGG